ncbi:MAG: 3,4-dihydroxy-2-butanone-4-phosphate synthase [Pseudomonadota bacterium]
MGITSVDRAIDAFKQGKFVIIVDDEDRENEGDLAIAGEFADPAAVNFCAINGRGLICLAMSGELIDRFNLPMMVPPHRNRSGFGTAFTVSVEAAEGVTTGISAGDRARTISALINPDAKESDIVTPGHMFPLRAKPGGVLERGGQTEASVDLALLAGLTPAAMICEVMNADGTMVRLPDLEEFSQQHEIEIVSVEAIAEWRRKTETVQQAAVNG